MKSESQKVFGSDQEELNYINNYFNDKDDNRNLGDNKIQDNRLEINKVTNTGQSEYKPITLTKTEVETLVDSIRYNKGIIEKSFMNLKIIKSLLKKGFIRQKNDGNLFLIEKNVQLLFDIEGETAFDEIIE